jgi:hypothetical protein
VEAASRQALGPELVRHQPVSGFPIFGFNSRRSSVTPRMSFNRFKNTGLEAEVVLSVDSRCRKAEYANRLEEADRACT